MEDLRPDLFLQRIPAFHRYEGLTAEEQGKHLALPAEIRHLPMNVLIFDQATDIPVNHPVKLGDQDDVIAEFSMLRKETEPFVPPGLLPVPGIEQQLTLVNDDQHSAFWDVLIPVPVKLEFDEVVRGHFVVGTIGVIGPLVLAQIHRKIPDHRTSQPGPIDDCPGTMQALTRAGCAAIQ